MPNLRAIETFVKTVEGGSIAAAARQLGITPAAASQGMARLERELGTRLLTRTTRSMALTEAGERYLAHVQPVLAQLEAAQADIALLDDGVLRGRLRVSCMSAFGRHLLAALMPAFLARHPQLQFELLAVDRQVDVLREDIDVAIRYRDVLEPGMAVRPLAAVPRILYAAPGYLAARGRPRTAQDLLAHDCLLYRREVDGRFMRWPFVRDGERVDPPLRVAASGNDIDALSQMAVHGAGIAWLGVFIARPLIERGLLEPLALHDDPADAAALRLQADTLDFFACFRDRRNIPAKVRALVDYLVQALDGHPLLR